MPRNFTMSEFLASETAKSRGYSNFPTWEAAKNLEKLGEQMELVRAVLGNKPILISSGYRSPQLNAVVGGAAHSAHLKGLACDFTCPAYGTPFEVCRLLRTYKSDLQYDQLIYEVTWVHFGLSDHAPRLQELTIDENGTRNGF